MRLCPAPGRTVFYRRLRRRREALPVRLISVSSQWAPRFGYTSREDYAALRQEDELPQPRETQVDQISRRRLRNTIRKMVSTSSSSTLGKLLKTEASRVTNIISCSFRCKDPICNRRKLRSQMKCQMRSSVLIIITITMNRRRPAYVCQGVFLERVRACNK